MQFAAQVSQNQTTASSTQKYCRTQLIDCISSQLKVLQEEATQVALLPVPVFAIPDATPHVPDAPDLVLGLAARHVLVPVPVSVTIPVRGLALAPALALAQVPVVQAVPEDARDLVVQTVPLHVLQDAPVGVMARAPVLAVIAMVVAEMDVRDAMPAVKQVVAETLVRALAHLNALIAVHSGKKAVYQNE